MAANALRTIATQTSRHGHTARFLRTAIVNTNRSPRTFSTSIARHGVIPFEISGTGTGVAQSIAVKGSPHTISVDAYPSFGGQDAAPSPLAYNLSSLSSCTQVTGSLVAKDHGLNLGKWEVSVLGDLDPAVLAKGVQGNGNWDAITLKVNVQVDTRDEQVFQRFAAETERRCPITQLFKRSGVKWSSHWVNGSV